ncbi:MAG: sodium ion-translocating decarboxylase subunit beta, partial [Salinimicrobium sediminis]|nr:sodium ion-translocating decarboxylase subunit beta [Salinimicrobium sediminis]
MKKLLTVIVILGILYLIPLLMGQELMAQSLTLKISEESGSLTEGLRQFWEYTGFANASLGNFIMIAVGLFFIYLAIRFHYEPLLLIPIGTGILLGNIPFPAGAGVG